MNKILSKIYTRGYVQRLIKLLCGGSLKGDANNNFSSPLRDDAQ